jgi:hypothetical protein
MKIATIGIDLAKDVFQVYSVNARGKLMLRRQLKHDQMAAFIANLPPCLIGMEAYGTAYRWTRKLQVRSAFRELVLRLLACTPELTVPRAIIKLKQTKEAISHHQNFDVSGRWFYQSH